MSIAAGGTAVKPTMPAAAQNDCRSIRCGDIGANVTRGDVRNVVIIDTSRSRETVDLLENIERHFLLRINQRHDLELKVADGARIGAWEHGLEQPREASIDVVAP